MDYIICLAAGQYQFLLVLILISEAGWITYFLGSFLILEKLS